MIRFPRLKNSDKHEVGTPSARHPPSWTILAVTLEVLPLGGYNREFRADLDLLESIFNQKILTKAQIRSGGIRLRKDVLKLLEECSLSNKAPSPNNHQSSVKAATTQTSATQTSATQTSATMSSWAVGEEKPTTTKNAATQCERHPIRTKRFLDSGTQYSAGDFEEATRQKPKTQSIGVQCDGNESASTSDMGSVSGSAHTAWHDEGTETPETVDIGHGSASISALETLYDMDLLV